MRVNDLSKELGKPNRELIEFLRDRGVEHKAPMSNVSEKEAEMIRNYFKPKKTEAAGVKKTETAETIGNHQAEGQGTEAAPKKKKFTAVFRPQNAQQIKVKPAKPQAKAMKPSEQQPLSREAAGNPASGAVAPAPELPKQAEGAAQLPEKKREEAAAAEETRGTIQKPEETNQAPEASKPSAPPQEKKDAVRPAVAVRPERSISQTRPRGGYSGNRRVLERLQQQDRDQASRRGRTGTGTSKASGRGCTASGEEERRGSRCRGNAGNDPKAGRDQSGAGSFETICSPTGEKGCGAPGRGSASGEKHLTDETSRGIFRKSESSGAPAAAGSGSGEPPRTHRGTGRSPSGSLSGPRQSRRLPEPGSPGRQLSEPQRPRRLSEPGSPGRQLSEPQPPGRLPGPGSPERQLSEPQPPGRRLSEPGQPGRRIFQTARQLCRRRCHERGCTVSQEAGEQSSEQE